MGGETSQDVHCGVRVVDWGRPAFSSGFFEMEILISSLENSFDEFSPREFHRLANRYYCAPMKILQVKAGI